MATKMEAKFEKYWGKGYKINKLLYVAVAVVLDPRKKMRFLKFSFFESYGDEVADEMVDLVRTSHTSPLHAPHHFTHPSNRRFNFFQTIFHNQI